jgi:hypothetical protein
MSMPTVNPAADSGLARIIWCLFGPMALLVASITIAEKGGGWFGAGSLLYLLVLASTLLARWIDYRGGKSQTADGKPVTPELIRRYFTLVPAFAALVWIAAHLLGRR